MKIIRPQRLRSMPVAARLATRYEPVRLASSTRVKVSSLIRSSRLSSVIPAFDTSTSIGPWDFSTSVKAASMLAGSVTSHTTPASPSGGSPDRWVTVTRCPASANARAMASPIPRLPPVTSTDRPVGLPGAADVTGVLQSGELVQGWRDDPIGRQRIRPDPARSGPARTGFASGAARESCSGDSGGQRQRGRGAQDDQRGARDHPGAGDVTLLDLVPDLLAELRIDRLEFLRGRGGVEISAGDLGDLLHGLGVQRDLDLLVVDHDRSAVGAECDHRHRHRPRIDRG